jgi:hypothetical protein
MNSSMSLDNVQGGSASTAGCLRAATGLTPRRACSNEARARPRASAKKHHGRRGSRPSTVYEARRLFKRALAYLGDKPVHEITKKDILA